MSLKDIKKETDQLTIQVDSTYELNVQAKKIKTQCINK